MYWNMTLFYLICNVCKKEWNRIGEAYTKSNCIETELTDIELHKDAYKLKLVSFGLGHCCIYWPVFNEKGWNC